jgi:maltokinase
VTSTTGGSSAGLGALLADHLGHQRWFAGKGRDWRVLATTTAGTLQDAPRVWIELVSVGYPGDELETYQVPLVAYDHEVEHLSHALVGRLDGSWVYEALADKEVTGLWLSGIGDERRAGTLRFRRDPSAEKIPEGVVSIVVGAEQSNTSLVFGDQAILKVFRKVAPGINPDIEVHAALASAGSIHIAEPLGWLEGTWHDPVLDAEVTGSLAMLQAYLPSATDGWEMAQTSVRDLYAEADLRADEVGGDFAAESHRLGAATAEVHADLARTLPNGVFDARALAALAAAMRGRLDRAAAEVEVLRPYVEALREAYEDLARLGRPVAVQRIHGDFHLGQVMRTLDGWRLLDFEGEPAKSLAERRALDSPVRDVAGMLRSFDYAARHLLADGPHDAQREFRATEWAERNRSAFCDGYAETISSDPRDEPVLLRAYETDKAVYELVYESRNRPSWVSIPLSAIARLANG